ncbi:MAG: 4Fe-4S binding protein [Thermodesulfobacteriota bacterium]
MLADHGYQDASGSFFITIDTDRCNGCGACLSICPENIFEVVNQDPNDPFREIPVVIVREDKRNKLKYECGPCKRPADRILLSCVEACPFHAITHSW